MTLTDDQIDQLFVLDAQPGPALPIADADADALIDAALAGAGFGPTGGPGSGGGASSTGGLGRIGVTKLVTGLLAMTVVAFVIAFLIGRHRAHEVAAAPPDAPPDAAQLAAVGSGTPEPAPTPAATIEPGETMPTPRAPAPTLPAPEPAPPAPHPATEHPVDHSAGEHAVNDLLGEANAKRAAHQWRESDALYARVVKRVPKSAAAQTALVASGSLHLEHFGDPRGAAERFRRALAIAPSGPVAEDARWGLAEAARALGDNAAEAKALDDFLEHFPESPLASRARARRQELK